MTTARLTVSPASGFSRLRAEHPLAFYIFRRIVAGLITVLIASLLIFLAVLVLPGNTAQIILGRTASPQALAAVNHQLGANQSVLTRYVHLLSGLVTGHLGTSTVSLVQGTGISISSVIGPALAHSALLALITLILFTPLMFILGVTAGLRSGSVRDTVISSGSLAISALPEFLIGTLLILIFFNGLHLLPPISAVAPGQSPLARPTQLIMPVATLLLVGLAFGSRQLRASVADIASQDYVVTARVNGYSTPRIIARYILPNAVVPSVQIIGQEMQYLIGGIIVVESVFDYPGIGTALVKAISVQDVQELMIIATILAAIYIGINIVTDVVCVLLDPKVRTSLR